MCDNEPDMSSNEPTSDSIDQLVDAVAANEIVADDDPIPESRPTTFKNRSTYRAARSANFSKLFIIKF